MKLEQLSIRNNKARRKVAEFRKLVQLDPNKPFGENFHTYKNTYPYFDFVEISINGCKPFLMFSNNDDLVAMCYFWCGENAYERRSISEWVSRSKDCAVILDVGTCSGLYSFAAVASARTPNDRPLVFSFEPTRRIYARLLSNIVVNNFGANIKPVNLAVSNCSENVKFFQYRGENILGSGASFIDKGIKVTSDDEIVRTISLDEFVQQEKIEPELIKIDVEQAEILVIEGMQETLSAHRPTLIVEIAPHTVDQVASLLRKHGYKLFSIDEDEGAVAGTLPPKNSKVFNILATK